MYSSLCTSGERVYEDNVQQQQQQSQAIEDKDQDSGFYLAQERYGKQRNPTSFKGGMNLFAILYNIT
jgi:hypothetical protein